MPHIIIIGAGITGITTAYALSNRGFEVSVVERERYAAMQTSFANGGQLSASNAEVWNHWSTILKGLTWMFKRDAPLLVNPAPSWHKYTWLAEFAGGMRNYHKNTLETVRLAIKAREYLFLIAEREGIDFDHVRRGILHIYWDKRSFQHALQVNKILVEGGLDRQSVTRSEIRTIEPALTGEMYGGFFTPSDSTGDIYKFTSGLEKVCKRRGVRFLYDCLVTDVAYGEKIGVKYERKEGEGYKEESLEADGIVICAGSNSRRFAAAFGDRVNIYPVKGYSITVHLDDAASQRAAPWISLLDDRAKIVTSRLGAGRFRVAGTAEFNGQNRDVRQDRVEPLTRWVRSLFPEVDTSRIVSWAGLRPMMPNMMPRVGKGRLPGVYYNTGHGHLGWTLSAATAETVSEAILHDLETVKAN